MSFLYPGLRRLLHLTSLLLAFALTGASAFAQAITRATTAFPAPAGSPSVPLTSVAFGNGTFVALGLKGRPVGANPSGVGNTTGVALVEVYELP